MVMVHKIVTTVPTSSLYPVPPIFLGPQPAPQHPHPFAFFATEEMLLFIVLVVAFFKFRHHTLVRLCSSPQLVLHPHQCGVVRQQERVDPGGLCLGVAFLSQVLAGKPFAEQPVQLQTGCHPP